jgi:hypothetical protein
LLNTLLVILFIPLCQVYGQQAYDWKLAKEKEGIRIYLAPEPGSSYKAYRGETTLPASPQLLLDLLSDVSYIDEWDESISEVKVLESKEGEYFRYYLVYDVPWPATDRDLCVKAVISKDKATGVIMINTISVPDLLPEKEGLVRMEKYWQRWIITPTGDGMVHLVSEGFADPAGNIPAWIYNMVITNSPMNILRQVRNAME